MALAARQAQAVAPASVPTVGELWEAWEPWAKPRRRWDICASHKNTFRGIETMSWCKREPSRVPTTDGRSLLVWELPWTELTPAFADNWRAARSRQPNGRGGMVSDQAINREITTLQSMLTYHVKITKRLARNPLSGWSRADEEQHARQTFLTPTQVESFITAGHPRWQDMAIVAYRCAGMRLSEVRLLRKSEVNWDLRIIELPARRNKNRKARIIPFPDDVEEILRRHVDSAHGEYVFTNPRDPTRSQPVPAGTMQYWTEGARARSGLVGVDGERVVFHSLRHAGVTELVTEGAPESFVKAAAGMSDRILARYVKFSRPQQDALREIMERRSAKKAPPPANTDARRRTG